MQNAAEFHHAGAVNNSCGMPPVDHHPVIINTLPFLANFYKFWGWCIYFYNKCGYWVIISKKLELEFGLVYKIWKITYLILILFKKIKKNLYSNFMLYLGVYFVQIVQSFSSK